ncbi:Uu.00g086720.m01.CDS01 [Anthostomella pinea]|uniref:Uu.00g086720.m01.CDS01 n=1 Tax=Anthostomella pinea TaxID=933095 RepID=A0AAI8YJT3_9PEZI|nr:Uu.00g086720.m01.CDS01 [Anthostomella pinea]
MSNAATFLSIAILGCYLLIALAVYTRGRNIPLPRMPSSVGSLLAYTAGSRAYGDFSTYAGGRQDDLASSGYTYTFGSYIGKDGRPHIGIERDPFVEKLDSGRFRSWGARRRKRGGFEQIGDGTWI